MKTMCVGLIAAFALAPAKCDAENLLTNGSFEMVGYPTNSIIGLSPGTTNLPGWALMGTGSAYLVAAPLQPSYFTALDGKQFFDFNHPTLTLSQTFPTRPGESYEVTFSAGRFQGPTNMLIVAQILATNGVVLGGLTANVPSTNQWAPPSRFRFTATTTASTLQFHGSNATVNVDLAMDAVSVQAVSPRLTIDVSEVRLCWQSQSNRMYQLQFTTNVASNTWTDSGAPIPGSGATDCSFQPVADPQRFYRVVLLP